VKCLLLAAGYATRLYPLTKNFPKPLLKIGDKTILDWLIEDIEAEEFIVISNPRFADHFRAWAAAQKKPVTVVDDGTETNEGRLGAVRDIEFAIRERAVDDDCLILAGDNVLDFSLRAFLRYAEEKKTDCVMRYFEPSEEKLRKCGVLELEGDRVIGMEEKPAEPRSHWCCPPFYYYRRETVRRIGEAIADGCGVDAPGSLVAWVCRKTEVNAFEMPGKRYDVGNLESYEKIRKEYKGYASEEH